MIFVTVGTHEQPFRRLVEYMDNWASEHDEEVLIQAGYTDYRAKYAKIKNFLPREEMAKCISQARIVITHGGPACYSEVLRAGKVPVVVPRSKKFGEQYDNHQIEIGREFKKRNNILLVEDIDTLSETIEHYDELSKNLDPSACHSNNDEFCAHLNKIVDQMLK